MPRPPRPPLRPVPLSRPRPRRRVFPPVRPRARSHRSRTVADPACRSRGHREPPAPPRAGAGPARGLVRVRAWTRTWARLLCLCHRWRWSSVVEGWVLFLGRSEQPEQHGRVRLVRDWREQQQGRVGEYGRELCQRREGGRPRGVRHQGGGTGRRTRAAPRRARGTVRVVLPGILWRSAFFGLLIFSPPGRGQLDAHNLALLQSGLRRLILLVFVSF